MEIYLLRHGEAGQRVPVAARDMQRALTAAGKKEIEEVGEVMVEMGYEFDIVATSPLKRAKDTASIVNKALERKSGVEEWPELSPEGNRETLYKRLAKIKPGSVVMCVGHEPYLTTAIGEITRKGSDGSSGFRIVLKKGGLARLSVAGFSPRISGELRWLLTPKQLRKMA
ncbi:MAG: phosphohistidine phosphatase SixA [Thaumarchaeota archaeon]|nr:phosphohistidine phosphatase SixA [Nitrososphaerota archaeon]